MEIGLTIHQMKEIYSSLIENIDSDEDCDVGFIFFDKKEIFKNKEEIISIMQLLSRIADNHHRMPNFFNKIVNIIQYLIQEKQSAISDFEIYQIFKNNKGVLLLLLEQGLIKPDEKILSDIMISKDKNNFPYSYYLYSGIKSFINEDKLKKIEIGIKKNYDQNIQNFELKCHIGENDSYVCSLIRQDLVEEFISYINRTNTSLSSQILPSIYETNSYLIERRPTLIEYASFFGSIQIIQYLHINNIPLKNSLLFYAIHSNSAELFYFLEENGIKLQEDEKNNKNNQQNLSIEKIYEESILCHHNAIADYIKDNFLDQEQCEHFGLIIVNSCNYNYFPTDIEKLIVDSQKTKNFCISQLCFSVKHVTIPSSVTSIGNYSFEGCSSITQITIPSSVTKIGKGSFRGCSSLSKIIIPSSVTEIGSFAFSGCSSLEQIIIPSSVTEIGSYAFNKCYSLKQISIPSSVNSICDSVFRECSSLEQISIPSSVTKIGNFAFRECSSLKQIDIPLNVVSIGTFAFSGCSSLKQITIPSRVTKIGSYAFSKCSSLNQILIPSSVTSIGSYTFSDCSSLSKISIPSKTSIGSYAFKGCSLLSQDSIKSSEKIIGKSTCIDRCKNSIEKKDNAKYEQNTEDMIINKEQEINKNKKVTPICYQTDLENKLFILRNIYLT